MRLATASAAALGLILAVSASPVAPGEQAERPIERQYAAPGPSAVAHVVSAEPCDRKGDFCDVYYPEGGPVRLPVVIWGNGTDQTPSPPAKYAVFQRHLASWGFVVVAPRDGATGTGESLLDAADYIRAEGRDPQSPLFSRIDEGRMGAAGHSQGASGAANAMLHSGGAITAALMLHLPQQAFCNPPENCLRTPDLEGAAGGAFFYLSGEKDFIISPDWLPGGGGKLNSLTAYYEATPDGLPKAKAIIRGADHNDILGAPDCPPGQGGCSQGAGAYLGLPTAWLAWRLQGVGEAGAAFAEGGELFRSPNWTRARSNAP